MARPPSTSHDRMNTEQLEFRVDKTGHRYSALLAGQEVGFAAPYSNASAHREVNKIRELGCIW
jgi:hypothetical protein